MIAVDHLLVCVGKRVDVSACGGQFGTVLPAEADGYRAVGFVGLRDAAVKIKCGGCFIKRVIAAPARLAAVAGGDESENHIPVDIAHLGFELVWGGCGHVHIAAEPGFRQFLSRRSRERDPRPCAGRDERDA